MAYIPARPIVANDPLAYFAAFALPKPRPEAPIRSVPADRALDQMYGYYTAE